MLRRKLAVPSHNAYKLSSHFAAIFCMHAAVELYPRISFCVFVELIHNFMASLFTFLFGIACMSFKFWAYWTEWLIFIYEKNHRNLPWWKLSSYGRRKNYIWSAYLYRRQYNFKRRTIAKLIRMPTSIARCNPINLLYNPSRESKKIAFLYCN